MRRIISAFRDPQSRPRAIIWTAVALIFFVIFLVVSLGVTSTSWFCNEVCHTVHYDNALQYKASSHSEISCLACHIPANLDGLRFILEKAEKLPDIYVTLTNTFEMPLNKGSHIALTMPTNQCTQCHNLETREITPSSGILISHTAHEEAELNCAVCHNRVAHPEVFELELTDNEKHEDYMTMTACFRCHTLTDESPSEYEATGECSACHSPEFELKPPSHFEEGFYTVRGDSSGHAELAREEASSTAEAQATWDEYVDEFHAKQPKIVSRLIRIPHGELIDVPPVATVNECDTCHVADEFCDACHGIEIPHPSDFIGDHAEEGLEDSLVCANCHNRSGDTVNDERVCDQCHHDQGDPNVEWFGQHPDAVIEYGGQPCFECHREVYCSSCHVRGEPSTPY